VRFPYIEEGIMKKLGKFVLLTYEDRTVLMKKDEFCLCQLQLTQHLLKTLVGDSR